MSQAAVQKRWSRTSHEIASGRWWVYAVIAGVVALDLWLFKISALASAAVAGVLLLVLAAVQWPALFLMLAFVAMPFQQSLGGEGSPVHFSAVDIVAGILALALPVILMRRRAFALGPAAVPIFVFLGVDIVSSTVSWDGLGTGVSLARMTVATLIAVAIYANIDTRQRTALNCFNAYLLAIDVLAVFSVVAFLTGGIHASEYTLGLHKNALGPSYGCGIVIALGMLLLEKPSSRRRLWLAGTLFAAVVGIVLSLSRGGWIATAAGCLLLLFLTKQVRAFVSGLVIAIPAAVLVWHALPEEATEYASDISAKAHTIQTRFATMQDVMAAFHKSPIIGVGVGLRKQAEPHNVFILTLGETGILGAIGFVAMFAGGFWTFVLARRTAGKDRLTDEILILGMSVLLVSVTHGMMDVYWRRGVGFMGWAAVGMAANIIATSRRRLIHGETRALATTAGEEEVLVARSSPA
ncbi:MAG: O-antigen ligase family protein [Armatimonadetes bacterium]|nr:O-antigen ligase family protein [Armatimonadota bacterium]